MGSFKQLTYHPVAGDLTVRDDQTFTIKNFVYDGEGKMTKFINRLPKGRWQVIVSVHHKDQNLLEEIKEDCVFTKEGSSSNPSQFITPLPLLFYLLATSLGITM